MKQTVLVQDHPFMRTILISAILLLSLCTTSFSANTDTQKTHFQNANNYTVKIRSRVEYPFLKDERGSFSGAGFLINRSLGWIATNAHVSASNPTIVEVAFKGHRFNEAKLIYVDHLLDLAVLRVPNSMIPEFAKQASLECQAKPIVGSPVGAPVVDDDDFLLEFTAGLEKAIRGHIAVHPEGIANLNGLCATVKGAAEHLRPVQFAVRAGHRGRGGHHGQSRQKCPFHENILLRS